MNNADTTFSKYFEKIQKISKALNKLEIKKHTNELSEKYKNNILEQEIKDEKHKQLLLWIGILLISVLFIIISLLFRKGEKQKKELLITQNKLKQSHENLEGMVAEQTKEIRANSKLLKLADDKKTEFIGLLSHNLGTQVNQIVQIADSIEVLIPHDVKTEWYQIFEDIIITPTKVVATQFTDIIHQMRLSLELQNGSRKIQLVTTSLSMIKTILEYKSKEYTDFHISTKLIENNDTNILLDETSLAELLKILINNSIKFSKHEYTGSKNESPPQIQIITREDEKLFYLEVLDKGSGFTEKALDNFGKQFELGEEILNVKEGLGIGLFIAKLIMQEHNGSIIAENNIDGGAKVTLSFPKK